MDLASYLYVAALAAIPINGQVVGVADGDTLTLLTAARQEVRVRLAEIDAPEKAQPFGQSAKTSLSALCFRKPAQVQPVATDRYDRTVGRVTCAGVDANAEQIRRGLAWFYRAYGHDPALKALEAEARASRRGLWADPQPIPPWDWRHK